MMKTRSIHTLSQIDSIYCKYLGLEAEYLDCQDDNIVLSDITTKDFYKGTTLRKLCYTDQPIKILRVYRRNGKYSLNLDMISHYNTNIHSYKFLSRFLYRWGIIQEVLSDHTKRR